MNEYFVSLKMYKNFDIPDEKQIDMIKEGMADIANKSCIKFRPRVKNEHAVTIQVTSLFHNDILSD